MAGAKQIFRIVERSAWVLATAFVLFIVWAFVIHGPPHEREMAAQVSIMQQAEVVLLLKAEKSGGRVDYRVAELWRWDTALPLPAEKGEVFAPLRRTVSGNMSAPDAQIVFFTEADGRLEKRLAVAVRDGRVGFEDGWDWLPSLLQGDTRITGFRAFVLQ